MNGRHGDPTESTANLWLPLDSHRAKQALQLWCCWRWTNRRLSPRLSVCVFSVDRGSSCAMNYIHLLMSFQRAAFYPASSLHGMVWIVTLCSQCNHRANSQACAAALWANGGHVFVCLNKHCSFFDVRFVWVSNNIHQREGLELLGTEQRLLHPYK